MSVNKKQGPPKEITMLIKKYTIDIKMIELSNKANITMIIRVSIACKAVTLAL